MQGMHSLDMKLISGHARAWLIVTLLDEVEIGPVAFSVSIAKLRKVLKIKVRP